MGGIREVLVSTWAKINDTADIEYDVFPDGQVEFTIGGRDGFMLVATERGLQRLLAHAEQALQEVREVVARDNQDPTSPPPGSPLLDI